MTHFTSFWTYFGLLRIKTSTCNKVKIMTYIIRVRITMCSGRRSCRYCLGTQATNERTSSRHGYSNKPLR